MFKYDEMLVYTALDADRLGTGDIVAAANTLFELQHNPNIRTLDYIKTSKESERFVCEDDSRWEYAQLIARHDDPLKEQKIQDALQHGTHFFLQ